ncbi:MAG: hypothetical protein E7612_03550 [Ruminococcaceae bacterium]|nr:hypothetical protein [Oscillospiraceae bacterium]
MIKYSKRICEALMKTLYIDIYFLINFTVDLLALYFSALFYKLPITTVRLMLSAFIGAAYAVFGILLLENSVYMYPISVLILITMIIIITKGSHIYRKIKYCILFLVFEILIGGLVFYGYTSLDKFEPLKNFISEENENKKLILLSVLILFSIGVLKLIISLFNGTRCHKSVKLIVEYNGEKKSIDAFVDSGNLAVDPFDKTPVMLIGQKLANEIYGNDSEKIYSICEIDASLKKKIKIIPVSFGAEKKILYGIKPDFVYVKTKTNEERISLTIAIDKEGGCYGGYNALIPLSALDDIPYENL